MPSSTTPQLQSLAYLVHEGRPRRLRRADALRARRIDFARAHEVACRVASHLEAQGIRKGDRLIVWGPSGLASRRRCGGSEPVFRTIRGEPAVARLLGAAASEGAFVQAAPGRRVIHVATHGFFLGASCPLEGATSRGVQAGPPGASEDGPLLLSGLSLAGANHRAAAAAGEDDGILTSEEIAGLDLGGVEWAVLSGCDTGVGDVRAGESVSGLRRAFQVAGVRTLVMSLWPVDDEAARRWMRSLYEARLGARADSPTCVHQASLEVLRELRAGGQDESPLAWGAFVSVGDWR